MNEEDAGYDPNALENRRKRKRIIPRTFLSFINISNIFLLISVFHTHYASSKRLQPKYPFSFPGPIPAPPSSPFAFSRGFIGFSKPIIESGPLRILDPQTSVTNIVVEDDHEIFVLKLELGFFACQVNGSNEILVVHPLSSLCDGIPDCYLGSDEDATRLRCSNQCKKPCINGACLDSGPPFNKAQCHCNDGFGGCACEIPDENECQWRPCDVFALCSNNDNGYECRCQPGYNGNGFHCEDIDECQDPALAASCGTNAECCNVPGSYTCKCRAGFIRVGDESDNSGRCIDVDECSAPDLNNCGLRCICHNLVGSFRCECPVGFQSVFNQNSGRHDCVDINECLESAVFPCAQGARCVNNEGSFQCICQTNQQIAFNRNARCPPPTSITSPPQPLPNPCETIICGPGSRCIETGFNSATCICQDNFEGEPNNPLVGCVPRRPVGPIVIEINCPIGFTPRENLCVDINECLQAPQPCARGAVCTNTQGSFDCRCETGLTSINPFNVNARCLSPCEQRRCGLRAECIETQPGVAQCICRPPLVPIRGNAINGCEEIVCPEDSRQFCGPNAVCRIQDERVVCDCVEGFEGNPPQTLCRDINECLLRPCAQFAICTNQPGRFTCQCPSNTVCKNVYDPNDICKECPSGFRTIGGVCIDINECAQSRNPCEPGGRCLNTEGSYQCICSPGFEVINNILPTCADINECLDVNACAPNAVCTNTPGSFQCECPLGTESIDPFSVICASIRIVEDKSCGANFACVAEESCQNVFDRGESVCVCRDGFEGNPIVACVPIEPPTCNALLQCGPNSACVIVNGGVFCRCLPGFFGNPPIELCSPPPDPCAESRCLPGKCRATGVFEFVCDCPQGFMFSHNQCIDVNECVTLRNPCNPGRCENTPGFYNCHCPRGFREIDGACIDINECTEQPGLCRPGNCFNELGSYRCVCPSGYIFSNGQCVDVNECAIGNPCFPGTCVNVPGSFSCECPPGFVLDPSLTRCTDVNECLSQPCGSIGTCLDLVASYQCICPIGYKFADGTCLDVNECVELDACSPFTCTNTPGSYICQCPGGTIFRNGVCEDINECIALINPCGPPSIECINLTPFTNPAGQYTCRCREGFTFNGVTCVDINECLENPERCSPGRCVNRPGSFMCLCPRGYRFENGVCRDINECIEPIPVCAANARCFNTAGSYQCECPPETVAVNPLDPSSICAVIAIVDACAAITCAPHSTCQGGICECDAPDFVGIPPNCEPTRCDLVTCGSHSFCRSLQFGGIACVCDVGYEIQFDPSSGREICVDINECVTDPCSPGRCTNLPGGFRCDCPVPFLAIGGTCVELPCAEEFNPCTGEAECVDRDGTAICECPSPFLEYIDGSCRLISVCVREEPCGIGTCIDQLDQVSRYICNCPPGYVFAQGTCTDVNECVEQNNPCGSGGRCNNTPGRYECVCPPGTLFDGRTCTDINECLSDPCGVGRCENVRGSYTCRCPEGYHFDSRTCVNINECFEIQQSLRPDVCTPGVCIDLDGGFTCSCPSDFTLVNGRCQEIIDCAPANPCVIGTCLERFGGGYRCVCPPGYEFVNGQCRDINECIEVIQPCTPGQCINTDGGFECVCPLGYEQFSGRCVNINECAQPISSCAPEVGEATAVTLGIQCIDTIGSFECQCPIGMQFIRNRGCVDINECTLRPCNPGQCQNTIGSYICTCPEGFREINGRCEFRGCAEIDCPDFSFCRSDHLQQTVDCVCHDGYRETVDRLCVDVNECIESSVQPCSPGECINLPGRFTCSCPLGYQMEFSEPNAPRCIDIDECVLINPCLPGQCSNIAGGYRCDCPVGFNAINGRCVDVDECTELQDPCSPGLCINNAGAFQCVCPAGFVASPDQHSCIDVNECIQQPSPCLPGTCRNSPGSYVCQCPDGYVEDTGHCIDVNECVPQNPCRHGECVNTDGNFYCQCFEGFEYNRDLNTCLDINECLLGSNPCIRGECVNTIGFYSCDCPTGFVFNGFSCEDINECIEPPEKCSGGQCSNTLGGFNCICPADFILVNEECVRIRQSCELISCGVNALCEQVNVECMCPEGMVGDPLRVCEPIPTCIAEQDCGPNSLCRVDIIDVLTPQFEIQCVCKPGFKGTPPNCVPDCPFGMEPSNDGTCLDINECQGPTNPCRGGRCQNNNGGFTCECPPPLNFDAVENVCVFQQQHVCQVRNPCSPGECQVTGPSHACQCPAGYIEQTGPGGSTCVDVNECLEKTDPCAPFGKCENKPGSFACICQEGYVLGDDQITCIQINECAELPGRCGEGTCIDRTPGFDCQCPAAFQFQLTVGTCVRSITICEENPTICGPGNCISIGKLGFHCECLPGFAITENGQECIDVNECVQNPCTPGECFNQPGFFECRCPDGYQSTGTSCVDINECIAASMCGIGTCVNLPGSFECTCPTGYFFDGISTCIDINECAEPRPPNCGAGRCRNTIGAFECVCPNGFVNSDPPQGPCIDVRECLENPNPCEPGQCIEQPGSYRCICPIGFSNTGGECADINECVERSGLCAPGTCENTIGSYVCVCPAGFSFQSQSATECIDINECLEIVEPCGAEVGVARCINTVGAFQCICKQGFTFDSVRQQCTNINECVEFQPAPCQPGRCEDTIGNYICHCPSGFEASTVPGQCIDINECVENPVPCRPGTCVNTIGAYDCICPEGYHYVDGQCVDINECVNSNRCVPGECLNLVPGFRCICPIGFDESNGNCVDINECVPNPCAATGALCEQGVPGTFTCVCPNGLVSPDPKSSRCVEPHPCSGMTCLNQATCESPRPGECSCNPGFEGVPALTGLCSLIQEISCPFGFIVTGPLGSQQCIDIDECVERSNPCIIGKCINEPGRYRCQCPFGYQMEQFVNEIGQEIVRCVDINECIRSNPCTPGECRNTEGSYRCECPDGYRPVEPDALSCEAVFVCKESDPCAPYGTCFDVAPGRYQCQCDPGFQFVDGTCIDINECITFNRDPCLPGSCINTLGSYQCNCPIPGYIFLDGRCIDIDECKTSSGGNPCRVGQCQNIPGSYRCICPVGYEFIEGSCVDVNECENINPCGEEKGTCLNTIGSYDCSCFQGFQLDPSGITCIDINECIELNTNPCEPGFCINSVGSYICQCPTGFRIDASLAFPSCVDIEECKETPGLCAPGTCIEEIGSFRCICPQGFESVNNQCIDINECAEDPRRCSPGRCENVPGSYICHCPNGYQYNEALGTCVDVNECLVNNPCLPIGTCVNEEGGFRCICPTGYSPLPEGGCIDINECFITPNLCQPGECENIQGSYHCVCPIGYNFDGQRCVDFNECINQNPCIIGVCTNILGGYRCDCPVGYEFTDGICTDINECAEPGLCDRPNQFCINTQGSFQCRTIITRTVCEQSEPCRGGTCIDDDNLPNQYRCECPKGMEFDGFTCIDINECLQDPTLCSPGSCQNIPQSFFCICPSGYENFEGSCVDINECVEQPLICGDGECENLPGSYTCNCLAGFQFVRGTCKDINECINPRVCGPVGQHVCENIVGGYRCVCQAGFEFNGEFCVDINECVINPNLCVPGQCENLPGRFRCICPSGFDFVQSGNVVTPTSASECVDINECVLGNPCGVRGTCQNVPGTYECICDKGFEFVARLGQCFDINECLVSNPCGVGTCQNIPSTYQCFCPEGYRFIEGGTCVNINECVEFPQICGDAECVDRVPSYECICPIDFQFVPERVRCVRVRERCESIQCGTNAICVEIAEQPVCRCPPDMTGDPNVRCDAVIVCDLRCPPLSRCVINSDLTKQCVCDPPFFMSENEVCVRPPPDCSVCAPTEICRIQVDNSVSCEACPVGFEKSVDGQSCVDINECFLVPPPCRTNEECINNIGSYTCRSIEIITPPEISIKCLATGVNIELQKSSAFFGIAYVKGLSRDPLCSKQVRPTDTRINFQLAYGQCGVNVVNGNVQFVLVVQKHPNLVTVDATAYTIDCHYSPGEKVVTSSKVGVSMITTHGTIANTAPPPLCQMHILDGSGNEIQSATIGEGLRLKIQITHGNIYGAFASNCYARAVDNSVRYRVTDDDGCATDRDVFGEWTIDPDDNQLYARFSAFKFPSNNIQRFQCNVRVCFGTCPSVKCGPDLADAYGRKKRDTSLSIVKRAAPFDTIPIELQGQPGDIIDEIRVESNGFITFETVTGPIIAGINDTNPHADDVCLTVANFWITVVVAIIVALICIAISICCWCLAYPRSTQRESSQTPTSNMYYNSTTSGVPKPSSGYHYYNSNSSAATPTRRKPDRYQGHPKPDYD